MLLLLVRALSLCSSLAQEQGELQECSIQVVNTSQEVPVTTQRVHALAPGGADFNGDGWIAWEAARRSDSLARDAEAWVQVSDYAGCFPDCSAF